MTLKNHPFKVFSYVIVIFLLCHSEALFKLKNIKCTCYEKSYCEFKRCELKVLGRGLVGLFVHAQANQVPINSVTCHLTLFKRFNGYKPFLFNMTVDVCYFFKNKKRYPFFDIVYDGIKNFSNVNHTCPFNHDIIVERMVLNDKMIAKVPVPSGFYRLNFYVRADGAWRGELEVYAEVNLGYDR
ncbi:uncharacterized protein LOC108108372 [Drosophila eugracilis]|uniref:uncharacterized protein LOC108108372 n=1 Tax=Drosophila eugracilis TaxID=29029 RepID=UPI0007E6BEC9|nr:uncharacterized protein LOC108108372 [Drosophila eugracilis]